MVKYIRIIIVPIIIYCMKKRNFILIFGILLFEVMIAGGTMAYLSWENGENTLVTFTIDTCFMCSADVGEIDGNINSLNVRLAPSVCTNEKHVIKKKLIVYPTVYGDCLVQADIWLDIVSIADELSASENFKYAVTTDENSCTNNVVAMGSFTGANTGDKVSLLEKKIYHESIDFGDVYWLYIWLDAAETSFSTANKSFSFVLNGTCTNAVERND